SKIGLTTTLKNAWTTSRQVNFFWVANFNLKFGITRTFRNNQYLKRKKLKEFIKPCYNRYSYNFIYNKRIEMTELERKNRKIS
ncbi:hypothetical protein, partial [Streptococcus pneumoniae]